MSARTERRKQEPHASGMVTEQEIVRGLRDLGLEAGDLVLAAGFPDLSAIQGGAETVVTALLEAVGPEGTVAMHTGEEVGGWPRPLFNRESSASEQGPVSDAFWRRPGAKRTAAPTGSVAAIGPLAEELTGKHDGDERRDSPWDDRAFSHESPWQQSYDRDARYLLLGGDWNQATLFRLAGVMYLEGMRGKYRPDIPYPTFSQSLMGQKLADEGLVKETKVGPVSLKAVSVRTLVDRVLALLRADPLAFFPVEHEDRFGFTEWYRHIPQMEKRLQAGFAKVKITPETPINHRGVYQDIWARAMVVRDEDTIIALALIDLALIDLPLVKEIRRRVEEQCHIPAHNLMVGCTHTHRAPSIFGAQNTIPYAAFVVEAVVQAVCEAVGRLQPVRVGVNKVETKDLVINRRMKMIDGRVYSSRYSVPSTWYVPPEILQGTGPVDPWLTSLRFENLEGEVVGLLGNFTGHPLAAFRSRYISGDSFGHAEELLETVHEGAVAMLTNGAEGNTIVRGPFPERGPRYDPQAEIVGQIVGGYWLTAQAGALPVDGGSVAAAWREVEMPVRESFLERMRNSPPEVQRRNAEVVRQGKMVSEMQVLRINDIALVAMPGEVFVEVQLMLKEKSPFPHTVVVGCANDVLGYVPTREAFSEGGYEVDETGEWNRPTEDTLGMLGMTALDLIRGLWRDYQEKNAHE